MDSGKTASALFIASLLSVLWITAPVVAGEKISPPPSQIPFEYGLGKLKFQQNCSSCHGDWGDGTEQGPPLMHGFYKPSHHGDAAFYRAALRGVRAHHWKFGDMPPVQGITARDMDAIVPFVRWLQRERGLYQ